MKGVRGVPGGQVFPLNPAAAYLGSREEIHERIGGYRSPLFRTP